jgi:hypothetical protein
LADFGQAAAIAFWLWSISQGANFGVLVFSLYVSLAVGSAVVLVVVMPLMWSLIRLGCAGPGSAIAVVIAIFALGSYPDFKGSGRFLLFFGAVAAAFLCLAYTQLLSKIGWSDRG